jgi:hypothetical protein
MLILVVGACLAAITITVICKLVVAPALTAIAAFASVLITGTIIPTAGTPPRGPARSRRPVT